MRYIAGQLCCVVLLSGCAHSHPATEYEVDKGYGGAMSADELRNITQRDAELMKGPITPVSRSTALADVQQADATIPTLFDASPTLQHCELPPYPEDARLAQVEGVVTVFMEVNTEGVVDRAFVMSSPDPRLSDVSLKAVRTWRFAPLTYHGQPIRAKFVQKFPFRLH